ncbi:MAG: hypothetical protein IPH51_11210 [Rubrivivax sp.]|nr:hypothetical protein [Rubrivivax sp.]
MSLSPELLKYLESQAFSQGDMLKRHLAQRIDLAKESQARYGVEQTESSHAEAMRVTLRAKAAADVQGGVCEALAMKWIKMKRAEVDQGLKGDQKPSAGSRMQALSDDQRFGKAIDKHDASKKVHGMSLETLARSYKMPMGQSRNHQSSVATVASVITGAAHGCALLSFFCPKYDNGPHAIGLYMSSGKILGAGKHVYLFDPNEGEFRVPEKRFSKFLRDLLFDGYGAADQQLKDFLQWPG